MCVCVRERERERETEGEGERGREVGICLKVFAFSLLGTGTCRQAGSGLCFRLGFAFGLHLEKFVLLLQFLEVHCFRQLVL